MFARLRTQVLLGACIALAAGCSPQRSHVEERTAAVPDEPKAFKIGVMTGSAAQCEDEFRAGQQVVARYPGRVKHITFPADFVQEQETVVAQLIGLAADPLVKVIVVAPAIPGSVEAARKIREQRPDILIGFVAPQQAPALVDSACDLAVQPDEIARGATIIDETVAMGARAFVHYSFPRHMTQELLARRRDLMKQEATKRGMKFELVIAPDPMEGGPSAAERFVAEDVPKQLEKLGPRTAFFATDCGMQEPLIKSLLTAKQGYLAEPCCPAPTLGYPGALGVSMSADKAGDIDSIRAENKRLIAAAGMSGHFGNWIAPASRAAIGGVVSLLVDAADGDKADYNDMATVQKYLADEAGTAVRIRRYRESGNQYLILMDHEVY